MGTLALTPIYLDPKQKAALQKRARARKTNMSEEVRQAVDAYLAGVTPEELELLDATTRVAEKQLKQMAAKLRTTNRKLDELFAEMERVRGGAIEGAA